jgi:hypothetical protein
MDETRFHIQIKNDKNQFFSPIVQDSSLDFVKRTMNSKQIWTTNYNTLPCGYISDGNWFKMKC